MLLQLSANLNLALNEDGALPGEPLGFLEGFIWFAVVPIATTLLIWVGVVAQENWQKAKRNRVKENVITRINE